jgi:hypothetical protein
MRIVRWSTLVVLACTGCQALFPLEAKDTPDAPPPSDADPGDGTSGPIAISVLVPTDVFTNEGTPISISFATTPDQALFYDVSVSAGSVPDITDPLTTDANGMAEVQIGWSPPATLANATIVVDAGFREGEPLATQMLTVPVHQVLGDVGLVEMDPVAKFKTIAVPIVISGMENVQLVKLEVSVVGAAGTQGLLGLYLDAGGVPTDLLQASQAFDLMTGSQLVLADFTISPGTYWVAFVANDPVLVRSQAVPATTGTTRFVNDGVFELPDPFGTAGVEDHKYQLTAVVAPIPP